MRPSLTTIRKALLESVFDPKKPSPLSVILQVGNSPEYLMQRARELILQAEQPKTSTKDALHFITTATTLITIAKVMMSPELPKPAPRKAKEERQAVPGQINGG